MSFLSKFLLLKNNFEMCLNFLNPSWAFELKMYGFPVK